MCLLSVAITGSNAPAERQVNAMLAALGGREAWAAVRNTVNDSRQNRAGEPAVVRAVVTVDFEQPRFRIETTGEDLHLIRVIDGDRHWRKTSAGVIEPVPEDFLQEDRAWYAGHVYRTIHRLARRDPALRAEEGVDGRLEVHEGVIGSPGSSSIRELSPMPSERMRMTSEACAARGSSSRLASAIHSGSPVRTAAGERCSSRWKSTRDWGKNSSRDRQLAPEENPELP